MLFNAVKCHFFFLASDLGKNKIGRILKVSFRDLAKVETL